MQSVVTTSSRFRNDGQRHEMTKPVGAVTQQAICASRGETGRLHPAAGEWHLVLTHYPQAAAN